MFNLFLQCYTNSYFNFSGRANRKEYIAFILFYSLINLLISLVGVVLQINYINIITLLIQLFSLFPQITLTTRRLHDFGYHGFFQCILLPILFMIKYTDYNNTAIIIGLAFGVMLIFFKGTEGHNKYGEPPEY